MILVDAVLRALSLQTELFERAARWPARSRERIVAMEEAEELFFRLYPYHYRSLQVIRTGGQLAKASGRNRDVLRQCESRLISLLMQVIRDGVKAGDVELAGAVRSEDLAFSLWALAFGMRALMDTTVATSQLGLADGAAAVHGATEAMLDGLGWRPLSRDWDYPNTRKRIRTEVFRTEWQQLSDHSHERVLSGVTLTG